MRNPELARLSVWQLHHTLGDVHVGLPPHKHLLLPLLMVLSQEHRIWYISTKIEFSY